MVLRKIIIFAPEFSFPKWETFSSEKIKKLSKTENIP